jgi:hypothetical protein
MKNPFKAVMKGEATIGQGLFVFATIVVFIILATHLKTNIYEELPR